MKLLTPHEAAAAPADPRSVLTLAPDFELLAEPLAGAQALDLQGVQRIDLQFPKFTDGRAYSQAVLLRRRLGYRGLLRATGEVLIDQLLQLQRCGFDEALLRASLASKSALGWACCRASWALLMGALRWRWG